MDADDTFGDRKRLAVRRRDVKCGFGRNQGEPALAATKRALSVCSRLDTVCS